MIPYPVLAVAAVPLLACSVWLVLRHVQRPVQVYGGLDEAASKTVRVRMRFIGKEPARIHIETEDDCRGGARVGPSQKPRPEPHPRRVAALPLHFRLLQRLGIECRMSLSGRSMVALQQREGDEVMKVALVFDDWRGMRGLALASGSIYGTSLGQHLSAGDLHSGTTWHVTMDLPKDIDDELRRAYKDHGAYAVFRVIPD